jgi:hypothetical protein
MRKSGKELLERADPTPRDPGGLSVRDLIDDARIARVNAVLDQPSDELLVLVERHQRYP